jgi:DNA-nicking Smr family endonuclease
VNGGRRPLSEADLAEWANYVRRVTPLAKRARPAGTAAERTPPGTRERTEAQIRPSRGLAPSPVVIGTQPGGLDSGSWHRLRTGRLPPTRSLDLHGLPAHRAFQAFAAFLHAAHAEHARCVEVITGRGSPEAGGVIRRELPLWLNLPELRPLVLAAAYPHPANPGAVRLLLRRVRAPGLG